MFSKIFAAAAALMAIAGAEHARLASMLVAGRQSFPYSTRRPGDRAHKRWKRARAAGKR